MRARRYLPAGLALLLASCGGSPPSWEAPPVPVVLLTDFGLKDDAIGLMRGVILSIAPRAVIADLSHEVARFDVREGARLITDGPGFYPHGSVFVVVVDPGVGTGRRAIVARLANGSLVVAPDNGVLTSCIEKHGPAEVREVTNTDLMLGEMSATFHGRDLFAPVGAHLADGVAFADVGPPITDWIRLEPLSASREGGVLKGVVRAIDEPFGNVLTNLPAAWLEEAGVAKGQHVQATFGEGDGAKTVTVPLVDTFGDVPEGKPLMYVTSRGVLGLALNMADFARTHGIDRGVAVVIRKQ